MAVIVSLVVDAPAQERWDALRRAHFPADRLVVGAHVTLFHALPDDLDVAAGLAEVAARPAFSVEVTGVRSLGRGVALTLSCPQLAEVHAALVDRWRDVLSPQDRQGFRAHVTVQNKVTAGAAARLLAELERSFVPWSATAEGLAAWRYLDGPWGHLVTERFSTDL